MSTPAATKECFKCRLLRKFGTTEANIAADHANAHAGGVPATPAPTRPEPEWWTWCETCQTSGDETTEAAHAQRCGGRLSHTRRPRPWPVVAPVPEDREEATAKVRTALAALWADIRDPKSGAQWADTVEMIADLTTAIEALLADHGHTEG